MRIVLVPDSFKGTMSSIEICDAIEKAIYNNLPNAQVVKIPAAWKVKCPSAWLAVQKRLAYP